MDVKKFFKDLTGTELDFKPTSMKLITGEIVCSQSAQVGEHFVVFNPLRLFATQVDGGIGYFMVEYDNATDELFQKFSSDFVMTANKLKLEYVNNWEEHTREKLIKLNIQNVCSRNDVFFVDNSSDVVN